MALISTSFQIFLNLVTTKKIYFLSAPNATNSFIVLKKWPLAKREASPNPMELFTPFAFSVILLNDIPLLNISTIMFSAVNVIKKT